MLPKYSVAILLCSEYCNMTEMLSTVRFDKWFTILTRVFSSRCAIHFGRKRKAHACLLVSVAKILIFSACDVLFEKFGAFVGLLIITVAGSVTRKKSPNIYKSCLKMISLGK